MLIKINRSVLCGALWESKGQVNSVVLYDCVLKNSKITLTLTCENKKDLRKQICVRFLSKYNRYWKQSQKSKSRFKKQYSEWIKKNEIFQLSTVEKIVKVVGRPKTEYSSLTSRSKRRRKALLRSMHSPVELSEAVHIKKVKNVKDTILIRNNALALYIDMGLSRKKYQMLRNFNKKNQLSNEKFPEYGELRKAKTDCYPSNIEITNTSATVSVQSLVDHTLYRLIMSLTNEEVKELDTKKRSLQVQVGHGRIIGTTAVQTKF